MTLRSAQDTCFRAPSWLGRLLLLAALCLAVPLPVFAAASPVPAAGAAEKPAADKAEAQRMIDILEDPAARARLVAQLRLLQAAEKGQAEMVEEAGLLPLISDKLQELSDDILDAVTALSDVTHLADWIEQQAGDPQLRRRWTDIFSRLAAILGGGVLVERLVILLLRAPARLLERRRPRSSWLRLPVLLLHLLVDLLPVGAFLAVAYGLLALPLFRLTGDASLAAVMLISAWALVRSLLALAAAVFAPGRDGLRLLPVDEESANYLFIWARRLTYTGIWGYFAVQALKLLGLPKSAYGFSLKLLGLTIASLLLILVLQNRQTVAAWIRARGDGEGDDGEGGGRGEGKGFGLKLQGLRNRLADIWHVLAGLYIVVAFLIWVLQVKGGFEYVLRASLLSLVILGAGNLLAATLRRAVSRFFAINEDLRSQFPQLEARANRYCAILHNVVRGAVGLGCLLALLQAWGANILSWLSSDLGRHLVSSLLSITGVLVGALILWELVNSSIERYLGATDGSGAQRQRSARARTLLPLLRNVVLVFLVVVSGLIVLSELGINIAPLLAGAGVVGVAIGFGSQKLVQDVITGAFILFEDTIAVGDTVTIAEHTGVVEGMTIRTLRLRSVNGQVHTLPFSSVNTVINMSRDFGFHVFDLGVAYHEDVDRVMEVIRAVGAEMRACDDWSAVILDEIEIFGLDKFADSAVVIRGRIKTLPGRQWAAGRDFNRRIKRRFDDLGIEIPFPTHTVHFGADKDAPAPAARLRLPAGPEPCPVEDGAAVDS